MLTMLKHWRCVGVKVRLHLAYGSPNRRSAEAYVWKWYESCLAGVGMKTWRRIGP